MDLLAHWLVDIPGGTWVHSRTVVVTDEAQVEGSRSQGWGVSGPFVPASQLQGAVAERDEALALLREALGAPGTGNRRTGWGKRARTLLGGQ